MKRLAFILAFAAMLNLNAAAQCCSKKINFTHWAIGKEWSNGFNALPDVSTNLQEFYSQYNKNKEQWDAVFTWLGQTDLLTIEAGKHPIPGTSLQASVEDSENAPLEKRSSESHYSHIDFQYVVKGTERFAILDHETSYPNCAYRPDVIHYNYDASKTMFIDSTPERFFLFFPSDWHIAKINNDGDDQKIRVIVVKLDYVK